MQAGTIMTFRRLLDEHKDMQGMEGSCAGKDDYLVLFLAWILGSKGPSPVLYKCDKCGM